MDQRGKDMRGLPTFEAQALPTYSLSAHPKQ